MSILPINHGFSAGALAAFVFTHLIFAQEQSLEREHQKHLDQLRSRDEKSKDAENDKSRPLKSEELTGEWQVLKIGDADGSKSKIKIKLKEEGSTELVL